jgi:hypothetical protein
MVFIQLFEIEDVILNKAFYLPNGIEKSTSSGGRHFLSLQVMYSS